MTNNISFYKSINLNRHEVKRLVIQRLSTPPSITKEGQVYYNRTDKEFYGWDGNKWRLLSFEDKFKGIFYDLEDVPNPELYDRVGISDGDHILIYMYDGQDWVILNDVLGLIDDENTSFETTYSSEKIEEELDKKANEEDIKDGNLNLKTSGEYLEEEETDFSANEENNKIFEVKLTQEAVDALNKAHTHPNKSVIDSIDEDDIIHWDEAYDKAHDHPNKDEIDKIESGDKDKWDAKAEISDIKDGELKITGTNGIKGSVSFSANQEVDTDEELEVELDDSIDNIIKITSKGLLVRNSNMDWDNEEKIIEFTDNDGNTIQIDLSEFANDLRVTGGEYDRDTYVLKLTVDDGEGGTEEVSIDLKKLAEISHSDTTTIEFEGKGTAGNRLKASVKVSVKSGNLIEKESDGLFVSNKMSKLDNDAGYAKTSDIDYPVTSVNEKTGDVEIDKEDVGLGNVDNVKQASKTEFDDHVDDNDIHVTTSEKNNWNNKAELSDIKDGKFAVEGEGALTGSGEMTANQSGNSTAKLDLKQDTKDDIQKGVEAKEQLDCGIGGRNYLLDSREIFVDETRYHTRRFGTPIPAGSTVTVSIKEREWVVQDIDHDSVYVSFRDGSSGSGEFLGGLSVPIGGSATRTLRKNLDSAKLLIYTYSENAVTDNEEIYKYVKVEIGCTPTDWTPAPEDIATEDWVEDKNYLTDEDIGDGKFTVSGTGALTGSGEMTANQEGDSTANIDLKQSTKDDIAKGVTAKSDIDTHKNDTNNPHNVTASQVGAYTKSEADGKFATSDTTYSEITKSEAENKNSSTKRLISGRRLFDSFSKHITDWWNNLSISISKISGLQNALDSKANKTVKVEGTGSLTGGGTLSQNRTLDLKQSVKDKIEHGEEAYGWGDFRDFGLGRIGLLNSIRLSDLFEPGETGFYYGHSGHTDNMPENYGSIIRIQRTDSTWADLFIGTSGKFYWHINGDGWKEVADIDWILSQNFLTNADLPSVGTLTHLENGTDTEQRSYRPKDIHDFVKENNSLREEVVYFDKNEIDGMLSSGTGYIVIPAPASNEFIHVESYTITPKTGGEFPSIAGQIIVGNTVQFSFDTVLENDTKSENNVQGVRAFSERGEPCEIFFHSSLDTTDYVGQIKFTVRYRIVNNS